MAELDDQLRDAFARAAEPGDPSGVAEALRTRMAAGDTGTPSSSSGFGGDAGSWLPWVGLVVVAGLVGGASGLLGLAGHPVDTRVVGQATGVLGAHSVGLDCIGGPIAESLPAGQRVLTVARSADSKWLGVRNPVTLLGTVWVPGVDVTVDRGEPAVASLPVGGGCPVVSVVTDPPVVVTPGQPPSPSPKPTPKPTPDTTAPTLGKPTVTVDGNPASDDNGVCNNGSWEPPAIISISASDNVGVTGVSITWSGAETQSVARQMTGNWTFAYRPTSSSKHGFLTFTMTARDAAGNVSSPEAITIKQVGCVG